MKTYLSFGGGVNSVALYLHLIEKGVEFEAAFVHHSTDWPETYDYVAGFQWWIKHNGLPPIKILRPAVRSNDGRVFDNVYHYYRHKRLIPLRVSKLCTVRFKSVTLESYYQRPCTINIGFAADEDHRASIHSADRIEYRYPLIEDEIDREACKNIIREHDLPIPPKSGCYICPWQSPHHMKTLRRYHPELYCRAHKLETEYADRRRADGKQPLYFMRKKPLETIVEENQMSLWEADEYPPCHCGL